MLSELQVDVSFHGVPYLLTVSTINGETMCLEVEQKSDASRWRGDFTSRCGCPSMGVAPACSSAQAQAANKQLCGPSAQSQHYLNCDLPC